MKKFAPLRTVGSLVGSVAVAATLLGAGPASAAAVVKSPDQNEHVTEFQNDPCDPVADRSRHPYEQWITNEWDRYNGTTSFTNTTDRDIEFALEVTEGVNESVKATSSGNMWDPFFRSLTKKYGIVEVSEWAVGDKLGPVTVKPGETVRADYGVHMKDFIGRVRTCDQKTATWRTEGAFGTYKGTGPSTRFVVWHRTTKEGDYTQNFVPVKTPIGDNVNTSPGAATISGS